MTDTELTETQSPYPVQRELQELRTSLADSRTQVEASVLARVVAERHSEVLREDLRRVNEYLNDTAHKADWCGEYEDHIERINGILHSTVEFTGRAKDFEVEVSLTSTFTSTITISARNADQAEHKVNNMGISEVYQMAGLATVYNDSATDTVEVTNVEED
jgi:hypothetical protein